MAGRKPLHALFRGTAVQAHVRMRTSDASIAFHKGMATEGVDPLMELVVAVPGLVATSPAPTLLELELEEVLCRVVKARSESAFSCSVCARCGSLQADAVQLLVSDLTSRFEQHKTTLAVACDECALVLCDDGAREQLVCLHGQR